MLVDQNYVGKNGLYYFFGVVEDINDPLKLNRVRVRCYGLDSSSLTDMPTSELPWFYVGHPTTSAAISSVGETPRLLNGSTVMGIFIDGMDFQEGVVLCSIPAIPLAKSNGKAFSDQRKDFSSYPSQLVSLTFDNGIFQNKSEQNLSAYPLQLDEPDTSKRSRGESDTLTSVKSSARDAGQIGIPTALGGTFTQPEESFAASYPYNDVKRSESGHVFEMDDTRGSERVHLSHRTGTSIEMQPNGEMVDVAINDRYTISHSRDYRHVELDMAITVDKGMKILVNKDEESGGFDIEVKANAPYNLTVVRGDMNVNISDGNQNEDITGNQNVNVTENVVVDVGQNTTWSSGQSVTVNAQSVTVNAPSITLNGNVGVTGTMFVAGAVTTGSTITAGGDVKTGNGVSLDTHVHAGVTPGSGSTAPPTQ